MHNSLPTLPGPLGGPAASAGLALAEHLQLCPDPLCLPLALQSTLRYPSVPVWPCRPPPPSPGGHENSTLGVVGVPLDLKAVWVGVSMGTRVTSLPNNYP